MKKIGIFKKSQAAIEFLATYGWAIILVLTAGASLAYFGVLNLASFAPPRCVLGPEITCEDFTIGVRNELLHTKLLLKNNLPDPINITSIHYSVTNCTFDNQCVQLQLLTPGQTLEIDMRCPRANYKQENRFSSSLKVNYQKIGASWPSSKSGTISGVIKETKLCSGDMNGDGIVNFLDAGLLAPILPGPHLRGTPGYVGIADFNCDWVIDTVDQKLYLESISDTSCNSGGGGGGGGGANPFQ